MPSGGKPCPSGSQYSKQEKETCEAGKDLVKVVWFAEAVERLHQNSPRIPRASGRYPRRYPEVFLARSAFSPRKRLAPSFLMIWRLRLSAKASSGTSWVITDPEPT